MIEPTTYLENLFMPYVIDAVRERGALPYPIRAGFPVSWASHLDLADAVVALFDRPDLTGVVSGGQYPAITGPDLADMSTLPDRSIAPETPPRSCSASPPAPPGSG